MIDNKKYFSRDEDPELRKWKYLGYGFKTSAPINWRMWQEKDLSITIAAPFEICMFNITGGVAKLDGEYCLTEVDDWAAIWACIGHFYTDVIERLHIPQSR